MATIAATETQLSQQTKPTGMYDRPGPHKRLLVKGGTCQAEDAKDEHGSAKTDMAGGYSHHPRD